MPIAAERSDDEEHHRAVDPDPGPVGQVLEVERAERPQGDRREAQPQRRGEARQDDALHHELATDLRPARAEREPGDQLLEPGARAHEREVRHVDAADEQDEERSAPEQGEGGPDVPHQVVLQAHHARVEAGVLEDLAELREALEVRGVEGVHLRLGLLERRPRPQPARRARSCSSDAARRTWSWGAEGEGPPGHRPGIEGLDLRRHHPDDGIGRAVQTQLPADGRRVGAEDPSPQRLAQQDLPLVPDLALGLGERAAQRGRDGQHAEEGRGDVRHADPRGDALLPDGDAAVVEERLLGEHGDGTEPVVVVGDARVRAVGDPGLRVQVAHQQDTVRLGDGQRPQEDVVDDGEEGRVRANAERERQDHRGAVRPVPDEPSHAHPQVTPEPVHRALLRAQGCPGNRNARATPGVPEPPYFARAASIACRSSGDSGATLLGKYWTTFPSLPTRYLPKFQAGREPPWPR